MISNLDNKIRAAYLLQRFHERGRSLKETANQIVDLEGFQDGWEAVGRLAGAITEFFGQIQLLLDEEPGRQTGLKKERVNESK